MDDKYTVGRIEQLTFDEQVFELDGVSCVRSDFARTLAQENAKLRQLLMDIARTIAPPDKDDMDRAMKLTAVRRLLEAEADTILGGRGG